MKKLYRATISCTIRKNKSATIGGIILYERLKQNSLDGYLDKFRHFKVI